MSEKTLNTRLQVKRDTETNWEKATNFIPKAGEPIFYTDLKKFKIGDGTTTVNNLLFIKEELAGVFDTALSQEIVNKAISGEKDFRFSIDGRDISATDLQISNDFIIYPNNTAYSYAQLQITDADIYFDPNRTYIITVKMTFADPSGSSLVFDTSTSSIMCGGVGTTTFTDNATNMIYTGTIENGGISGFPNVITIDANPSSSAIMYAHVKIETSRYVDGLLRGEDKAKYDSYEQKINTLTELCKHFLSSTPQTLTDDEKAQALANLGLTNAEGEEF